MVNNETILETYRKLETEEIERRLRSGHLTDTAESIATDELSRRRQDPDAFNVLRQVPTIRQKSRIPKWLLWLLFFAVIRAGISIIQWALTHIGSG